MNELYGYKEKDVLGLIEYMKNKKGAKNLMFRGYAEISGKSVGTIRNLYYQIVKLSNVSEEFCKKYLGDKPLTSNKIEFFDKREEREILKKILLLKAEGYSVRNAINQITNGNPKLSLRYQNKYRGVMKNDRELVLSVAHELKSEHPNMSFSLSAPKKTSDLALNRLKTEINFLYERLFLGIQSENHALKKKNQELICELEKLTKKSIINKQKNALDYFKGEDENGAVN